MAELLSNTVQLGLDAPIMTSITPIQGGVGTKVTIVGNNFGPYTATTSVYMGTSLMTIKKWTNTSIEAIVPSDAITSKIYVQNANGRSAGIKFIIPGMSAPKLISLDPVSGTSGTEVTITLENGGQKTLESKAYIGGKELILDAWTDTVLNIRIPYGAESSNIYVENKYGRSNGLSFEVEKFIEPQPTVAYFFPMETKIGDTVTITGANFGNTQGRVTIHGTTDLNIISWKNEEIKVIVPSNATTGNIYVHVGSVVIRSAILAIGTASAAPSTNMTPFIKSISPGYGVAGERITITGVNLKDTPSVNLNGTSLALIKEDTSQTEIAAMLPVDATSGYLYVEVDGLQSNNKYIRVHPGRPRITSIFPLSPEIGGRMVIYGKNFMNPRFSGDCSILFGSGKYASVDGITVDSWTDTKISLTLPASIDYAAGYIRVKVFELVSDKWYRSVAGTSTAPTASLSSGEIRDADGAIRPESSVDTPPIVGVYEFAPEVDNLDVEFIEDKSLQDIINYIDTVSDPTKQTSITLSGVGPDKLGNINLKGLGLVTVISNRSENTVLIKGLTKEDLIIDLTKSDVSGSFCEIFGHCRDEISSTSAAQLGEFIKDITEGPGILKDRMTLDGDLIINGESVNQQIISLKPRYGTEAYTVAAWDHSHGFNGGTYYVTEEEDKLFIDGSNIDSVVISGGE